MKTRMTLPLVLLLAWGCSTPAPPPAPTAKMPEFRPDNTIKDIMDSMTGPSADVIWDSVATIVDKDGEHEKYPKTDEEWKTVRRNAVILLEASNLLLIPGRHVARPGEKAEDPKIELPPEIIEELINKDREQWNRLAMGLHDAVMPAFKAADTKDKQGIGDAAEGIDRACEACHLKYWYPENLQEHLSQRRPQ